MDQPASCVSVVHYEFLQIIYHRVQTVPGTRELRIRELFGLQGRSGCAHMQACQVWNAEYLNRMHTRCAEILVNRHNPHSLVWMSEDRE